MALKEWFRQMQPAQLYIVLGLSVVFFAVELVASHITHALTLLTDSYHMLCNIIALTGCLFALKYGANKECDNDQSENKSLGSSIGEELTSKPNQIMECPCPEQKSTVHCKHATQKEKSLKNTFGWARIDVVVMLICCVFLCSLCFSIYVEALQTLVHIDHQDEMHNPILVLCIGAFGLLLNGMCYLLIGGFTFHQGSFLYVTPSGDVVLDRVVTNDSVRRGERRLSRTRHITAPHIRERENCTEMFRDVIGCVLVIICSIIVYFTTDKSIAKYVDPIMSMISAGLLMALSYPYVKESCLILLQTMPDTINIDSLKTKLLEEFPDIVNVHDLHVWQLTASKIISTAHIIFKNPMVYAKYTQELNEFFIENGITQVTIQPEFFTRNDENEKALQLLKSEKCLMNCLSEGCKSSHCCPEVEPKNIFQKNSLSRSVSRELSNADSTVDLKSIKIVDSEASITPTSNSISSSRNSINSVDSNEAKSANNEQSTENVIHEAINGELVQSKVEGTESVILNKSLADNTKAIQNV